MADAWYPYTPPSAPAQSGSCAAPTPRAVAGLVKVLSAVVPLLGELYKPPTSGRIWPRRTR